MRLGKALATGVAEEQVPVREDEGLQLGLQLPEEVEELEASVDEVPVVR